MVDRPASAADLERDVREVLSWWPTPSLLADYAQRRIGFGHEGYGIAYPDVTGEEKHEILEIDRHPGHVEIYGFYGNPEGFQHVIPEAIYLEILARLLRETGRTADADAVEQLIPDRRF